MEGICGGEEPEETDSVRCVVPKEPGLVRVDWFELPLMPEEVVLEEDTMLRDTRWPPKECEKRSRCPERRDSAARGRCDREDEMGGGETQGGDGLTVQWRGDFSQRYWLLLIGSATAGASNGQSAGSRESDGSREREAKPREERRQERWKQRMKDERRKVRRVR